MKTFKQFHGEIPVNEIGKILREIIKEEKNSFKILTGYGSSSGNSASKKASLRSLSILKKEGLIKEFFPGEIKNQLLLPKSMFYQAKINFGEQVKNDVDYGNDGIIFVFVK